jgi:hypothetical protein
MLYKVMSIPQHKCSTHKEYHKDQQAARSSQIVGRMQHSWPRTGCPWPCHYPILLSRNHAAPAHRLLHTPHSPLRAKHHQDLKNESEQQPVRETTTTTKNPAKPKCSGANFQCSSTDNPYPSLSLCAKHLRARQQAIRHWEMAMVLPLEHGDRESRYAQCVRTRHVGVKVRTRAWRRNLPNLIRNSHEPANYVRSGRSSSTLCGVKVSLWARYAAYTHPFSSLCGVQLELHSAQGGKLQSATELSGRLTLQNGQHRGNSCG